MGNAFITESAAQHKKAAIILDAIADAVERFDSYDVASEFRTHAAMNRAVAEYYEAFPYTQGAYSGKSLENGDSAYQLYSPHFLAWLTDKAKEEERKELTERISGRRDDVDSATNDEPYEDPDE